MPNILTFAVKRSGSNLIFSADYVGTGGSVDSLTGLPIITGNPTISHPVLSSVASVDVLTAQDISTGFPTISKPALGTSGTAYWPTPAQVLSGTPYGPTGADYTGTAIAGSYPTAADIAAAVRFDLTAELARIDAAISSRSTVAAIMGYDE